MTSRRRVRLHRAATAICVVLAIPGVLWWRESILFVILVSLSTQAYTSWSAAEAADDQPIIRLLQKLIAGQKELIAGQRRIDAKLDALLEQRRRGP